MKAISILIGGKAGFGIDRAGTIIAQLLNRLGYRIYVYRDYPSVIRGGHTFSIIRAAEGPIACHSNEIDCLLALNQDTVELHRAKLKKGGLIIFDSDTVKAEGAGVALGAIIKEENAPEVMRNTGLIGSFCKAAGIRASVMKKAFETSLGKEIELNLKVAMRGFEAVPASFTLENLSQGPLPLVTGNEAIGMGLLKAGLTTYIAYPMTPTSPILHFLAGISAQAGVKVIHPENEIAVMLMAAGMAFVGDRVAVGSSGGGFCLMTEGFSFAGMAELPVVVVLGQRPGPSTGLPTYSSQTELSFALSAGQGEFTRLVVAPADALQAYYWSAVSLNLAWKYQLPAIILSDKNMGEGLYSFEVKGMPEIRKEQPLLWSGKSDYKRYSLTEDGISPLAFAPLKGNVVKVNSYEHDEMGITTEDRGITIAMQDKRLRKETFLVKELSVYPQVNVYGDKEAKTAIVCWGSNAGVCAEVGARRGMRVVQPVVLAPFPAERCAAALTGAEKVICVESNATGQLARLLGLNGMRVDEKILNYDGRPLSVEDLEEKLS